ncbi:uncharacterized protein G2W53_027816 [Senna tora]|uniref:Uncharacterized protein n=1 Tax=Senna tora TaxID=362788 RepID=A0A834TJP8_9FABA|nr:uncharacterized protein G2W53_027816 [Senna tora]
MLGGRRRGRGEGEGGSGFDEALEYLHLNLQLLTVHSNTCDGLPQLWPCSHHMLERIYRSQERQDNPVQPFARNGFGNTANLKAPAEFPSLPVAVREILVTNLHL